MLQPKSNYHDRLGRFKWWAADNGCFASKWDPLEWKDWLQMVSECGFNDSSMFAVIPDVFCDYKATRLQADKWLWWMSDLKLPLAYVFQDGAEADLDSVPWDFIEVGFIGGSDDFKLSWKRAGQLAMASRERGLQVHMGRVNSLRRLTLAQSWGCRSADGTYLKYGPTKNLPKLASWLEKLNAQD